MKFFVLNKAAIHLSLNFFVIISKLLEHFSRFLQVDYMELLRHFLYRAV